MSGLDENLLTPDELDALRIESDRSALEPASIDRMARRLELAIGVGGAGGGGGSADPSGGGSSGGGAGAAGAAKGVLASAAVKGGALFAAGLFAGALGMKAASVPAPANTAAPMAVLSASAPSSPSPSAMPEASARGVESIDIHALPNQPRASAAATDANVPSVPRNADLVAESQLIDGVRTALSRGDPESALGLLDAHERKYKSGALREEADAFRVRALAMAGRSSEAAEKAESFRRRYPKSLFLPTSSQSLPARP